MSNLSKRLDALTKATGGARVIGVWREESPEAVRITQPPDLAGVMTLPEFEQLLREKVLLRVIRREPRNNDSGA